MAEPDKKPALPKANPTRIYKGSHPPTARQPLPPPNKTRPFKKNF